MYEALLRERMDAEQAEEFDELLASASGDDVDLPAQDTAALMNEWGGETVLC